MGILRTDKISGLETPTAVTGSVVFDGTGDYVTSSAFHISKSWTVEFWYNTSVNNATQRPMNFSSDLSGSNYVYIELGSSGTIKARVAGAAAFGSVTAPSLNQWHHTALSYDGSTAYFLLNGKLIASQSVSYSNNSIQVRFGADESNTSANLYTGYISNARIVSGKALYTTDYTVPIHAFEVIDGTNLLCFNNTDSAAASEHRLIGVAPPTLTVTGDAAASTVSPSLTRDFTSGTEFQGVTVFDTQGYFVPPSGTTEQRGRGRGLFGGGLAPGRTNSIDYIQIQTQGNAQDFGDLTLARHSLAAAASATRGLFGGGDPGTNVINFVTIASTGDAVDFGDLVAADQDLGGAANNTRGLFFGGSPGDNTIQYVTIASLGNAQDFGDLTRDEKDQRGCGSPTRCIIFERDASIDFVTFATTGNGTDFGDTIAANNNISACSDSTRGIRIGGGASPSTSNEYITIATLGNSQNFGSLTASSSEGQAVSDSKRGVISLGDDGSRTNAMDYITIQTTGNAQDFGDLTAARWNGAGSSDSHGGIS